VASGKPVGPKGGICSRCRRETGSLKVHARYCKGAARDSAFGTSKTLDRALPIPIVGGPAHGTIGRLGKGPRPWYLDHEGHPVVKSEGDRFMRGRVPSDRPGLYVVQHTVDGDTWYAWRKAGQRTHS